MFRKKHILKLLFINPDITEIKSLTSAIKGVPVTVVFQEHLDKAYIVDTGIEVKKIRKTE